MNQSVITLEGSDCDKRKTHQKLCKEPDALRCTLAVSLNVSGRFTGYIYTRRFLRFLVQIYLYLQALRFGCRIFYRLPFLLKI